MSMKIFVEIFIGVKPIDQFRKNEIFNHNESSNP